MQKLADISVFSRIMNNASGSIQNGVNDGGNKWVDKIKGAYRKLSPKYKKAAGIAGLLGSLLYGTYTGYDNYQKRPIKVVDRPSSGIVDPIITYLGTNPEWMNKAQGMLAEKTDGLGRSYADKHIIKKGVEDNPNYRAAMKRCQDYLDELHWGTFYDGLDDRFRQGFDAFGRFCANIDMDLSDAISKIELHRSFLTKRSHTEGKRITLSAIPSPSTIAHELIHALYTDNPAIRKVMGKPGYLMSSYIDKGINPYDITRGFVAGDDYAGKTYGDRSYSVKKPRQNGPHKGYLVGAVDRYRSKHDPKWLEEYDDEYLTHFMTAYLNPKDYKLPLLYSMDVRHKINQINEEARRMGVTYSRGNRDLQKQLTRTAKMMLMAGVAQKLPGGVLTKMVTENLGKIAESYLDRDAVRVYRAQQKK